MNLSKHWRLANHPNFLIVLIYLLSLVLGTFVFVFIFRIFQGELTKVPLFGMVSLLIFICFVTILVLWGLNGRYFLSTLTLRDLALVFLLLFFFNYNLYGLIPFNVSRSNSIIMMGYLNSQNGVARSEDEIQKYVEMKYFFDYQAVQKRLNEQVLAGNVEIIDGKYLITKRGQNVIELFAYVSDFYGVKENFAKINTMSSHSQISK